MNGWSQGYRPPAVPDLVMNFTLQRLLPHHRQVLGCIRAELDLITLQGQNDHFNQFSGGQFNDNGFAGRAGTDRVCLCAY